MIAMALCGPAIAITKSGSIIKATHIKGVKVLHVHAIPSKIGVGSSFRLKGIVINNSTVYNYV